MKKLLYTLLSVSLVSAGSGLSKGAGCTLEDSSTVNKTMPAAHTVSAAAAFAATTEGLALQKKAKPARTTVVIEEPKSSSTKSSPSPNQAFWAAAEAGDEETVNAMLTPKPGTPFPLEWEFSASQLLPGEEPKRDGPPKFDWSKINVSTDSLVAEED